MRRVDVSAVLLALVSIFYPLIATIVVRNYGPIWVLAGLFVLLALRALPAFRRHIPGALTYALAAVAALLLIVTFFDMHLSVRLYPAFMNAAMLLTFGYTLWRGPPMIERFARLVEPNLPESGVRYTRAVTWIWVMFFLINGLIASYTALFSDWSTWTLYNGIIAYIAMGALFGGELLVRPYFRRASHS